MEQAYKEKENKLDLMMELERLKELKYQEDKEKEKKQHRLNSARVIKNQIKENEIKRLHEREQKIREGELMKRQIKAMQEEDLRNEEKIIRPRLCPDRRGTLQNHPCGQGIWIYRGRTARSASEAKHRM